VVCAVVKRQGKAVRGTIYKRQDMTRKVWKKPASHRTLRRSEHPREEEQAEDVPELADTATV